MTKKLIVPEVWHVDEHELDGASNHVTDLIEQRQFEVAEAAAQDLLRKFPFVIDGLDHLATLYEAKGDLVEALKFYEDALAFTLKYAGFDEEIRIDYREKINQIKQQLP